MVAALLLPVLPLALSLLLSLPLGMVFLWMVMATSTHQDCYLDCWKISAKRTALRWVMVMGISMRLLGCNCCGVDSTAEATGGMPLVLPLVKV